MLDTIPRMARVKKIVNENEIVKSFVLDVTVGARPGQFVNIWIPRVDEKPFSVAFDDGKELTIAIAAVGPFSKKMHTLKVGDKVGIRGPFGRAFKIEDRKRYAFLGGGYGAAPLYFLAKLAEKSRIDFIVGARSKNLLLYIDRIKKLKNVQLHIATDDGSIGHKGYNTDILWKILEEGKTDCVCTVGPEIMMYKAAMMAKEKKIDAQISMERYMKCGFGVCGNCVVDGSGVPTCVNGPVMDLAEVLKCEDFGKYHRNNLGKKINYHGTAGAANTKKNE